MAHRESDGVLRALAFAVGLIIVVAVKIGFADRSSHSRSPPTPDPNPHPNVPHRNPKPESRTTQACSPKWTRTYSQSDVYHTFLTRLTDCLPNLTSEFESRMLRHCIYPKAKPPPCSISWPPTLSGLVLTSNPFRIQGFHQALTTVVLNCPSPQRKQP